MSRHVSLDTNSPSVAESSIARGQEPSSRPCPTGLSVRRVVPAEPPSAEQNPASSPAVPTQEVQRCAGSSQSRQRRAGLSPARRVSPPGGAHAAASALFRMTLEILGRRRPVTHLSQCATRLIVDQVGAISRDSRGTVGNARLLRVHVRPVSSMATEAFCTCERGDRVFAIAAKIELTPGVPPRWVCTSLRVVR
ncbi:Rv3235 family protein [Hoyosella subflava]|uniref:Rv3235 family protein n=1 Tax=Hoyosella subflava TaxID=639313 RepID=UPI0026949E8F